MKRVKFLTVILLSCAGIAHASPHHSASPHQPTGKAKFTLETAMRDGKLVYIGRSAGIKGQVNPPLRAAVGQTVEITLLGGDGILHDIHFHGHTPAGQGKHPVVEKKGDRAVVTFKARQAGTFNYYCSIPGHKSLGMTGKLIIDDKPTKATTTSPAKPASAPLNSVALPATALPGPLPRRGPTKVRLELAAIEKDARLADGTSYRFWTFNGTVPGPFLRVRVGDTVELHFKNHASSQNLHSIDFHAASGPGGGADLTQLKPGEENVLTFKALNPGIYVYHCATPMVAAHISNGMYGLILVEPPGGLPKVDRELYLMQGELYTREPYGQNGEATFSERKLLAERPEYFLLNGSVGALTDEYPMKARVGETVRVFYGVGGPNFTSSFHVMGEIFDRVYDQGSLETPALRDVQTITIPAGGAAAVDFRLDVPGRYMLFDHALSRMERGLVGWLDVTGPANDALFSATPPRESSKVTQAQAPTARQGQRPAGLSERFRFAVRRLLSTPPTEHPSDTRRPEAQER